MREDAIHLAGAQLALVLILTASLAIAAVPQARSARLMSARLGPTTAVAAHIQPAVAPPEPEVIRLQDMSPEQAKIWNASNPIAKGPNPAAKPFHLEAQGAI